MISKIINSIIPLLTYICVATCITLSIGVGYAAGTGRLNRDKLLRMLAIAYDIDPLAATEDETSVADAPDREDPAIDDVVEFRAMKDLDLDLRQQSVLKGLDRLSTMQSQLMIEKQRYGELRDAFAARLKDLDDKALREAMADVQRSLEALQPKQAKEQLLRILEEEPGDNDQAMRAVVGIIKGMSIDKRKKIFSEFKTEEESKQLALILRMIRNGYPERKAYEDTLENLKQGSVSKPGST
jgi:hypothetical protein